MKKLIPFLIVLFLISCKDDLLEDIKPKKEESNIEENNFSDTEARKQTTSFIQRVKTVQVNKIITFKDYMTIRYSDSTLVRGYSNETFDLNGDGILDIRFLRQTVNKPLGTYPLVLNKYAFAVNGSYLGKSVTRDIQSCDSIVSGLKFKESVCLGNNKTIDNSLAVNCKNWYQTNINSRDYGVGAKLSPADPNIRATIFSNGETKPVYIPIKLNLNGNTHYGYVEVSYFYNNYDPYGWHVNLLYPQGFRANLKVHSIVYCIFPNSRIITPNSI